MSEADEVARDDVSAPKKSGWGGVRKGAGRPKGSPNRQKKIAAPPQRPVPVVGLSTPYGVKLDYDWAPGNIKTSGSLAYFSKASVYVAIMWDGKVKIGMSSNAEQRCRDLRAKLYHMQPCNPAYARTLETLSLRRLDVKKMQSESTRATPQQAVAAIQWAYAELARICRIQPQRTGTPP